MSTKQVLFHDAVRERIIKSVNILAAALLTVPLVACNQPPAVPKTAQAPIAEKSTPVVASASEMTIEPASAAASSVPTGAK